MNHLPERINMPAANEIINTRIDRPFKPQETKQAQLIPANMQVCSACGKEYNQNHATILLEKLPALPTFEYQSTCLNCIKQASNASKTSLYPSLCKLKEELDKLTTAYQTAAQEYKALDYQEFIITHEQTQALALATKAAAAKVKSTVTKASSKKPSSKSLIMQILANLTPEQQATVLANIKAQTNDKPNEL